VFRYSLYIFRLLLAIIAGLAFCVLLYFAFQHFSGIQPAGLGIPYFEQLKKAPVELPARLGAASSWGYWEGRAAGLLEKVPFFDKLSVYHEWRQLVEDKALFVKKHVVLTVGLVSDSHEDNQMLQEALARLAESEVDFVVHLGDLSRVGTKAELQLAQSVLLESGIDYAVVPGDHDLWASEGLLFFQEVFGVPYQLVSRSGVCLLLIDDSSVSTGIDQTQWDWLVANLGADCPYGMYSFMHIPPYHPSSNRAMGEKSAAVKRQARELLSLLAEQGVKEVFSGDIHLSSRFYDVETDLPITVVGALTRDRNLQTPRGGVLRVFSDSSWEYEELVLME